LFIHSDIQSIESYIQRDRKGWKDGRRRDIVLPFYSYKQDVEKTRKKLNNMSGKPVAETGKRNRTAFRKLWGYAETSNVCSPKIHTSIIFWGGISDELNGEMVLNG